MTNPEFSAEAIVVVDDTPDALKLYQAMLERFFPHATLYFAHDGGEGIEQVVKAVGNHDRVVVLSDVEMPKVTGPQLVQSLRTSSDERIANVPIILNTAHAGQDAELTKLLNEQAGGHQFDLLRKPVMGHTLQQAILRALSE